MLRMDVGPPGYDDDYRGLDLLLFINLSGDVLSDPHIGIDFTDNPSAIAALRSGGADASPVFGGPGDTVLAELGSDEVWATLVPEPVAFVNADVAGAAAPLEGEPLANGAFAFLALTVPPDGDADGVPDANDNCPAAANGPDLGPNDQLDSDEDGIGDPCECGDASGDGFVNGIDARLIQRCAVGQISDAAVCTGLCDVTGDDACNSIDARLVQRVSVGQLGKQDVRWAARP